jgi:UDP-N-acetylmuramate: L-alanyl-gamma-D-glutamyl-meso-diaminopimelate ligase
MKLGTMKAQLPWALEEADLAFCLQGGLRLERPRGAGADGRARRQVADTGRRAGAQVVRAARPATTSCA